MSVSLEEALRGLHLGPGQTHQCRVDGQLFEVRALRDEEAEIEPFSEPPSAVAPEVPFPPAVIVRRVTPVQSLPPDFVLDEGNGEDQP